MDEKKKLKKLVLKKEEIVNLNDYQMRQAIGGSTAPCAVQSIIETVASIFSIATSVYEYGKDQTWWTVEYSKQANCMGDISNKIVNLPDGSRACELPEINVYGYRP